LNHRRIYELHYGQIPKDKSGRTYDIHHIDNNHSNNDPANLQAVTIQEHYDIHYQQGDSNACLAIAMRLNLTPEQISELSKRTQRERILNGSHNLLKENGGDERAREIQLERVANGIHQFLGGEINRKRMEDKSHNFLKENGWDEIARKNALKRSAAGTHNFQGGKIQKRINTERVAAGIHNWQGDGEQQRALNKKRLDDGTHQNLIEHTCSHCGKIGKGPVMFRHHFDNCKHK
jgi:hypothetical protein